MDAVLLLLFLILIAYFIIEVIKPKIQSINNKIIRKVIKYFGIALLVILSIVTYNYNVRKSIDKCKAENIDAEITAIGDINSITLSKSPYVDAIWSEYVTLTEDQQSYVTKLNTLIAADKMIDELQDEENQAAADKAITSPTWVQPTTVQPSTSQSKDNEYTVYITNTGSKYHRDGCRYLSRSKIAISKSDAISEGYTPCSVCNPWLE